MKQLPPSFRAPLFFLFIAAALLMASPPLALLLGVLIGLFVGHPYPKSNSGIIKKLLQGSVIGLGFGMNLAKVIEASESGIVMAVSTIAATLALGFVLARLMGIDRKIGHLISCGTAICGGSAIAAIAPVLDADEREMSVSLGTVFILNSIALLVFPVIGHALHLSQTQFGMWAAVAIHDTSSVVGAASHYGNEALLVATTVKLARALWIIPLVLLTSLFFRKQTGKKMDWPWFILFFLVASVLSSFVPAVAAIAPVLVYLARLGLTATLFLIGAGLSVESLRAVGARPLVFGVLLWVFIGGLSLWAVVALGS